MSVCGTDLGGQMLQKELEQVPLLHEDLARLQNELENSDIIIGESL